MYTLSVMDIFSAEAVQALCWTLVHSLWQGLLLAGIVALVIVFSKKSKAALRYHLFTASFVLFILTVGVTFYVQIDRISAETNTMAISLVSENTGAQNAAIIQQGFQTKASAGLDALAGFFNKYAAIIVFCWLMIISFKCVKLFTGLYSIQQIKRRNTSSVGSYWSLRVQQLSAQLGIKGHVQFLQSGIVKVPTVIGHFKPIIFFPLGALTALPPEDVEAILMHELAHIRRRDYLVNLLQHFAEIIFFFNPAVLWVSDLIKTERENCCDDIALQQMDNKKTYINALVSFQEFDATLPVYATAFSNKKEYLLQRVKRIVYNNNKTLNNMEKIFIAGCIFLTGTLSLVYAEANQATSTGTLPTQSAVAAYVPATFNNADLPEGTAMSFSDNHPSTPRTHYVFKKDGTLYETYGDRTWMKVNGVLIPQSQWDKYNDIVDKLVADYQQSAGLRDTIPAAVLEEKKAEAARLKAAGEQLQLKKEMLDAETQNLQAEKERLKLIEKKVEADKVHQQQRELEAEKKNLQMTKKELEVIEKKVEADRLHQKMLEIEKKNIQLKKKQVEIEEKQREIKLEKPAVADNARTVSNARVSIEREVDDEKEHILTGLSYSGNDDGTEARKVDVAKLTQDIITDLRNEKVITGKAGLSYQLTNESLIVNGAIQPTALHQQLKAKYIKSPQWKLMYNWRTK